MGSIHLSRVSLIESLTEVIGYKSGLVVAEGELVELLRASGYFEKILASDGSGGGRIRSEEYENAVVLLLYKLGRTSSPNNIFFLAEMYHKYKGDPAMLDLYMEIGKLYNSSIKIAMREAMARPSQGRSIDPTAFMTEATRRYGRLGLDMAIEMITGVSRDLNRSAWGPHRSIDWKDEIELADLFKSENLATSHGTFLDQRFIDYLDRNFEQISNIHWRKFEGLTGEFFAREGYKIDMGPGRNDDGIDLRVYPITEIENGPPLIIVQCKRVKAKIDKTLIKSVYADVLHEKASSGLIVTTSYLSPGAEHMRTARGYNVEAADRETLRQWISGMRTAD
ncbi:restriction endonuclease [Sphingobium sp. YR768]|uniref:restriction endonuclease n=1 Tax=Sphingobium sp. YR768 TaxID=1884365 RepID=UPI0008AE5028|nr:restriction endonuclease [Sphingobium sp. YR768]SER10542.1 restriction system protein [Sphingobium sp. YR768]